MSIKKKLQNDTKSNVKKLKIQKEAVNIIEDKGRKHVDTDIVTEKHLTDNVVKEQFTDKVVIESSILEKSNVSSDSSNSET